MRKGMGRLVSFEEMQQADVLLPLTDVIFRKWPKSKGGDVLALFPGDPGTDNQHTCSSFQHIGQHGSADPRLCILRTQPARPDEYAALKRELESAPYNYRLSVIQRHTPKHLAARRAQLARYNGAAVERAGKVAHRKRGTE